MLKINYIENIKPSGRYKNKKTNYDNPYWESFR